MRLRTCAVSCINYMARKRKKKRSDSAGKLLAVAIIIIIAIAANRFFTTTGNIEYSEDLSVPQFTAPTNSQIIKHLGYTVSYNNDTRNPNWVGYELTAEEVQGTSSREESFCCDPMVRGVQADDNDYKNSGWDRGHLAPAADMKWSKQAMEESFYLSNVSPQNKKLNRGMWKKLEEHCRDKAELYGRLIIITGPVFTNVEHKTIGENRVKVPDAFFKVMYSDYNGKARAIGFIFENKAGKKKLKEYARSVDEIETITQLDFFATLPDDIEEEMEKAFSAPFWGI